jgi:hypothetical protein
MHDEKETNYDKNEIMKWDKEYLWMKEWKSYWNDCRHNPSDKKVIV